MWDWQRENFEKKMRSENVDYNIWGKHGKSCVSELESKLNFKFVQEVKSFIENIGNLGIGSDDIIFTGPENSPTSCVTESEDVGLMNSDCPIKAVKIMDQNGVSFVLFEDGSIKRYDYKFVGKPEGELNYYRTFSDFMDSLIQEIHENA
jgi:hypothetical protein